MADDADHVIVYTGFAPVGTNNSVVSLRGDYKGTLSMTGTANATVAFRFRGGYRCRVSCSTADVAGTAVMLKGVTAPSLGSFSLTIDSTPQTTLSVRDNVATHNVPLFFTTALDDQIVHEVRVTTVGADAGRGPDIGLVLDRVDIWGPAGQTGFMWVHDYRTVCGPCNEEVAVADETEQQMGRWSFLVIPILLICPSIIPLRREVAAEEEVQMRVRPCRPRRLRSRGFQCKDSESAHKCRSDSRSSTRNTRRNRRSFSPKSLICRLAPPSHKTHQYRQ